jgi:hypothetical protein
MIICIKVVHGNLSPSQRSAKAKEGETTADGSLYGIAVVDTGEESGRLISNERILESIWWSG